MNYSAGPKLKLTIPGDSDGLDSADDCEEDHDLGERELHDISRERSCSGSEPELWKEWVGMGGGGKGVLSSD